MAAAWNELPDSGELTECAALVRSAEALCPGAPELAVQLARRALVVGASESARLADAGRVRSLAVSLSMRAQAVLAAGLVRTSRHVDAVEPAFAALALADAGGVSEVAVSVRVDLSACAREIGEPLLGGALLRPVFEAAQPRSSVRAIALGRFVGCVAHVARRDDVEDALVEADRLLAADDGLSPDARRMERARLSVRSAAYHRWYGDTEEAATAARDGLGMLSRLRRELRAECDRVRARLVFELVCALLDDGELDGATAEAAPLVDAPVRATSAAAVGQLMLAISTRVHLPAGQVDRGRSLLDQAAWLAERHRIDSVLADALTEISRLDERAGRTVDALAALRAARAAEQRRLRAVTRASRRILAELGNVGAANDTGQRELSALLRRLTHSGRTVPATRAPLPPPRSAPEPHGPSPHTDAATGLLNREGLFRRLRSVRNGERPVALTLVRVDRTGGPRTSTRAEPNIDLTELAGRVKDIAPDNAELARSDGGELAVLLPHTTRDQAEQFATTIREAAVESAWLADTTGAELSLSTGVVQSAEPTPGDDDRVDASALLAAARGALIPVQLGATTPDTRADTAAVLASALAEEPATRPPPEAPESALSEDTPTRPLPDVTGASESLTVGRSILSSLSIPTGSGGKRRAEGERSRWPAESGASTVARRPTEPSAGPPTRTDGPTTSTPTPAEPTDDRTTARSSYEQTKAELARMMSELTSGTVPTPPPAPSEPSADRHTGDRAGSHVGGRAGSHVGDRAGSHIGDRAGSHIGDRADTLARDRPEMLGDPSPQQSIPTPPAPEEVPDPSRRPDFPEPGEPYPVPPDPLDPGPAPLDPDPGPLDPGPAPLDPDPGPLDRGSGRLDPGSVPPYAGLTSPDPGLASPDPGPTPPEAPESAGSPSSWSTSSPARSPEPPPANPLFDAADEPTAAADSTSRWRARSPFKSSLAAAFESFGASDPASEQEEAGHEPHSEPSPASVDEQPLGPLQGPEPRSSDLPPRRDRSDSTTIAGLLAEALAAYQSTSADEEGEEGETGEEGGKGEAGDTPRREPDWQPEFGLGPSTETSFANPGETGWSGSTWAFRDAATAQPPASTEEPSDDPSHDPGDTPSWTTTTGTGSPRLPDLTAPGQPEPTSTPFSDLREQSGVTGRHRSPE